MTDHIIQRLFATIESRKEADPQSSYVASLCDKGMQKITEKITEEAEETIIEALENNKEKLAEESADLLFHLMVLWAKAGLKPDDIFQVLKNREGISGIDEKNSRPK